MRPNRRLVLANVKLDGVTKKFGSVTAINKLELDIKSGELFVLLGPTGAGKTTTLRCVAGLERQEEGNIIIDGENVNKIDPAQRDVAFVFQYYSLYPHYTVKQNLEFPLKPKMRRIPQEEIDRRVTEVAKILHIDHLLERRSDKLSGGEMQRVTIGRAIVRNPKVFLMDEPLSNLDAKLREELRAELKRLQIDLGATLFFVTHDQVEAMTMADRIAVLNKGHILQLGGAFDIYNKPANTFVASFVGSPDKIRGRQGEVRFGIRPEDIDIVKSRKNGYSSATIYNIENMGMEKIVTLRIEDFIFKAVTTADFEADVNAEVFISFKENKIHFFDRETHLNLA
jgi:multiple sugar transport system ATP-binding protein